MLNENIKYVYFRYRLEMTLWEHFIIYSKIKKITSNEKIKVKKTRDYAIEGIVILEEHWPLSKSMQRLWINIEYVCENTKVSNV